MSDIGISPRVPARITSTGAVKTGPGSVQGVLASTSSSGTLTLYDNTSAAGSVIVSALPLVAGQYYPLNFKFSKGLWAVIGGTADITFTI